MVLSRDHDHVPVRAIGLLRIKHGTEAVGMDIDMAADVDMMVYTMTMMMMMTRRKTWLRHSRKKGDVRRNRGGAYLCLLLERL
jgi:hypothetical protein